MKDYLQIYTLSVTVLGDFNPVIIQPFWLANKKLIRDQEAQDAKIDVIHNEIVKFKFDWASIEITRERFEIRTSQEPYFEPLKDLVIGIFQILKETPIKAIGINHLKYFALSDAEKHYEFGNKIAPLNNWNDTLNDPRLLQAEIYEQKRADKIDGYYRVRIQPSDIKLSTPYAILINMNDHLNVKGEFFGKVLSDNWKHSFSRSEEIIDKLWKKITS